MHCRNGTSFSLLLVPGKLTKIFKVKVTFVQNPKVTISLSTMEVMMVLVLAPVTLMMTSSTLIHRVQLWLIMVMPLASLSLLYPWGRGCGL